MRTSIKTIIAATAIGAVLSACDDALTNGSSIVDDQVNVFIDSTFTITATTVDNDAVLSRSVTGLLGTLDTKEYGLLRSDIVTQFMPAIELDTAGITDSSIDEVALVMRYQLDGYVGDSVAPMGVEVYPLTKQLPSPIYSDFNPEDYYDHNQKLGSKIYTATWQSLPDSLKKLQYGEIKVTLPKEIGQKLFDKYHEDPTIFAYPEKFAEFFPGVYIKNSYGSGRVMRVAKTTIDMRYHTVEKVNDRDTIIHGMATYLAVTPEIICNNNIGYSLSQELKKRRAEGQALVVAPAGYDTEIIFPAKQIIQRYQQTIGTGLGVVNSLNFEIPAETIGDNSSITPPPYLLMVLKSKKDSFFAENKITDDKTSFYATYNSTSGTYDFGSMRDFLLDLMDRGLDKITDEDITFTLTPVLVSTESNSDYYGGVSTYVTAITPYVLSPVMTRLLPEKAKIKFVYSRQTLAK